MSGQATRTSHVLTSCLQDNKTERQTQDCSSHEWRTSTRLKPFMAPASRFTIFSSNSRGPRFTIFSTSTCNSPHDHLQAGRLQLMSTTQFACQPPSHLTPPQPTYPTSRVVVVMVVVVMVDKENRVVRSQTCTGSTARAVVPTES